MVNNWRERTPPGFIFAAKIPQVITHEKVLEDCQPDLKEFLKAMDQLEDKLGPLLFQFPYFNKQKFAQPADFLARLKEIIRDKEVEMILIGMPRNMDGSYGLAALKVAMTPLFFVYIDGWLPWRSDSMAVGCGVHVRCAVCA